MAAVEDLQESIMSECTKPEEVLVTAEDGAEVTGAMLLKAIENMAAQHVKVADRLLQLAQMIQAVEKRVARLEKRA
jgi:hypothetical protein